MSVRDWTTSSAKYGAAFVLGAASLGGLAWSLDRRPAAVVQFAPREVKTEVAAVQAPVVATPKVVESPPAALVAAVPLAGESEPKPEAAKSAEPVQDAKSPPLTVAGHTVNLNTATQAELELLPGIGPALAKRILEFRGANGKFSTVEQLDKVKGIGPRTLEKLRPLVSVE